MIGESVRKQVRDRVCGQVWRPAEDQVWDQVRGAFHGQILVPVYWQIFVGILTGQEARRRAKRNTFIRRHA